MRWFNADEGYGYIKPDNGSADVLVHWSVIVTDGAPTLHDGQRVSYEVGSARPVPQATAVRPLEPPG